MTLRTRLAGAFLAVVLGPVLLGAVTVAGTLNAANQRRQRDRLAVAAAEIRGVVGATCDRMRVAAEATATVALTGDQPAGSGARVDRGSSGVLRIEPTTGATLAAAGAPGMPWALCPPVDGGAGITSGTVVRSLAAAVPLRDGAGRPTGYAYAAQPLDAAYVREVAGAAGTDVTLLADPGRSTRPAAGAAALARYAGGIDPTTVGEYHGTYVRRVDVPSMPPLAFVVSVPTPSPRGPVLVATGIVLVVALAAAGFAAAFSRATVRPLREITAAADRVARGDLDVWVAARDDEMGRLGTVFNGMTREVRRTVEALAETRDEALRLSHTDALTGLSNYRHLNDVLRREIGRAARFGHPLCAIALDLDRFKEVNDAYGHAAGDVVLVELARRLRRQIRGVDFAFRAGGEEFVLLLPETGAPGGVSLARRLGAVVRGTPFTVRPGLRAAGATGDGLPGDEQGAARRGTGGDRRPDVAVAILVTASIGVAVYPDHGASGAQLLRAADEALYAAKAAGRDTHRLAERVLPAVPVEGPGLPSAAARGSTDGASGGPHPPRQSRGR